MFWIDGIELGVGRHGKMADSWSLTRSSANGAKGVSRRNAEDAESKPQSANGTVRRGTDRPLVQSERTVTKAVGAGGRKSPAS